MYDLQALANKVEWEGSILDAMEYGIVESEILDPVVAALWGEAYSMYRSMQPRLQAISKILDEYVAEEY